MPEQMVDLLKPRLSVKPRETSFLFFADIDRDEIRIPPSVQDNINSSRGRKILLGLVSAAVRNKGLKLHIVTPGKIAAVIQINAGTGVSRDTESRIFVYWSLEIDKVENEDNGEGLTPLAQVPFFLAHYVREKYSLSINTDKIDLRSNNKPDLELHGTILLGKLHTGIKNMYSWFLAGNWRALDQCIFETDGILKEYFKVLHLRRLRQTSEQLVHPDKEDQHSESESKRMRKNNPPGLDAAGNKVSRAAEHGSGRQIGIRIPTTTERTVPLHSPRLEDAIFGRFIILLVILGIVFGAFMGFWLFFNKSGDGNEKSAAAVLLENGEDSHLDLMAVLDEAATRYSSKPVKKVPDREIGAGVSLNESSIGSTPSSPPVQTGELEQKSGLEPSPFNPRHFSMEAFDFFSSGMLSEAAITWREALEKYADDLYTVQLELDCLKLTVYNTYNKLSGPGDFFVLPAILGAKPCYRVLFGLYSSPGEAELVKDSLPPNLLGGISPPTVLPLREAISM